MCALILTLSSFFSYFQTCTLPESIKSLGHYNCSATLIQTTCTVMSINVSLPARSPSWDPVAVTVDTVTCGMSLP